MAPALRAVAKRITRYSLEWRKAQKDICGDGKVFDSVPLLEGPENWSSFYDDCRNAAKRMGIVKYFDAGLRVPLPNEPHIEGMLPILPKNVDDIDEYNDYIIALAEYEKVNEVLCGCIVSRCTKRLSDKVKDLLTVKAVLTVLKSDCTPSGAFMTILKHREIQALTLDSVADYLTFVLEFNRLIEEYNRLLYAA
ncbi:unnamed protein product [Zymoseptoria tritici ST99CH_3D7]|uniref:Uncharacterized protein n=1 Tax=Zymoseptoria tritici (strain ST99CH_3D7) TaxID=1276538 RepID=A0A1X7RQH4_ZYMT9|nr:unnamed protein product [Zymoseptoria tritici ST99CH_3D7]